MKDAEGELGSCGLEIGGWKLDAILRQGFGW